MARSAFEMYQGIRAASDEKNYPPVVYLIEESDHPRNSREIIADRPDAIIATTKIGPNELLAQTGVGHPHDIFVHAGDVSRNTGCSLETARNWLKKFDSKGIVRYHGEGDEPEVGEVSLYRPVLENQQEIHIKLYEMDGKRPPERLVVTGEVTPGQFEQLAGPQFRLKDDDSITIDVSNPDEKSITIQEHVNSQLRQHGLIPSSPKNFTYKLRKEAGLI